MGKTSRRRRKNNKVEVTASKRYVWAAIFAAGAILIGIAGWLATRSSGGIPKDFVPEVVGAPKASVSEEWIDYGDVRLGTNVETVFHVSNVGDETLYILDEPRVEVIQGC